MANEKVLLRAEALKLGIDGYRTMSTDELRDAIKRAKGTGSKGKSAVSAAPAKGKSAASTNGTKGKTAAKSAVKKGKTSAAKPSKGKSAPAKSTKQKSSPAKGKAAKGTAKRPTTAGKGKATTTAKAKTSAAKGSTSRRTAKNAPARVDIDRSQIDWRAESKVGASGKRKEVMDALRKHKGNYDKVFDALEGRARAFYKGKTKHEAERMLRWLINRVAFDFVMSTEQHTPGQRAAYGQSEAAQDIRRRARREEARKASARETRAAARKSAPAKGKTGRSSKSAAKTRAKGKGRK